jgi:hypothetical protein
MSENKVLSSTDVWSRHMFRILCGTCTEIYMAETDTSPHKGCPSVPHDVESEPVVAESSTEVPVTEPETKPDFIFDLGED